MSQGELARLADIDQGNLSKIENGRHTSPGVDTLLRIARAIAERAAERDGNAAPTAEEILAELSARDEDGAPGAPGASGAHGRNGTPAANGDSIHGAASALHIGFPHSVWSAPLIALRQDLRSETAPTLLLASQVVGKDGPLRGMYWQNGRQPDDPRDGGATANELVDLLRAGEVDAIVVAREVVSTRTKLFPCAEVMHGVGSSVLLIVAMQRFLHPDAPKAPRAPKASAEQTREEERLTFQQLWKQVRDATVRSTRKPVPLPLLFPHRTNAADHVAWLKAMVADRLDNLPQLVDRDAQLASWSKVLDAAKDALVEAGAFLFVGWDPQVSWLREQLTSDEFQREELGGEKLHACDGYLHDTGSSPEEHPLPYLSLLLCVHEDNAPRLARDPAFYAVLRSINEKCEGINNYRTNYNMALEVNDYLGIGDVDRCRKEFRALQFGVAYTQEWIELAAPAAAIRPRSGVGR